MNSSQTWFDAQLQSIRDITPTVREFTLSPASCALAYAPGAHLQLQVPIQRQEQVRSYSLVGAPLQGSYRIAVKRLDDGKGGSLALWRMAAGERLRISQPQNHFPLAWDAPAYMLVAGGIGVTPLLGMAQALAARGAKLRMLYSARSMDELAYAHDLQQALGGALVTVVGQRIDFATEIAALPVGAQLYVCGPASMLDAARRAWADASRPLADLRYETFGSSGRYASQAFRVQIPRHQLDITVPADCSLLDALQAAGVQMLFNCKRGECGLCAVNVLAVDGAVDHRDVYLSEPEKQANSRICTCVSRAVGSVTLDSAWRPD